MTSYRCVDSPLGPLCIAAAGDALVAVRFQSGSRASGPDPGWEASDSPLLREAARQLEEYFSGRRRDFRLPLQAAGTAFQQTVWQALLEIPYGERWSYGRLADRIGKPDAVRAVGAANGANPIAIVIPCHRVLGSGGSLTGYGGGLENKQWLLDLELRNSGLFQQVAGPGGR